MKQEGVQMNEDVQETPQVQESTPETQDESVDYKALYLDEVQNAKKLLRLRINGNLMNLVVENRYFQSCQRKIESLCLVKILILSNT
jgi:hypothetical protein